ncbi:translation initiation factor 2 (IF-2, GTPase) [Pseudomonas nitroreducens]|uniref:translation initiation factor 2 (IF-2, GTPase) n=1 Tax=Pseudomonas nitroreducens TaxID=46680 RepID=UPI00147A7AA5|nr:translation initiation factor 2 (IF-2, GTPase) [Pseudomonas nitroreducens]NNN27570.1 translation initiation factor 2 (IF-2, GTPase) [Pseudomonas nitroreducens]
MYRLPLLLCLALPPAALAEEPATEPPALSNTQPAALPDNAPSTEANAEQETAERLKELESRLAESEQQRQVLATQLANPDNSQDEAQIVGLRQENQRLKLQLREAQANQPPRLLTEQQTWYVAGAGTALLAFILGALARGRRRQRREWIN